MEWMDVYDASGNRTGQQAERYDQLPDGFYFLCTHVVLENTENQFLIQKRSETKRTRPGQWDITAGAVDAGETSLDAAIREAKEEVGLMLPREKLQFVFRDWHPYTIHDVYYVRFPFSLQDCTMQETEVQALRLISETEFITLLQNQPHRTSHYKETLIQFLQQRSFL